MEGKWERKEREERRRNIIIKGIKIAGEKRKEAVEEILRDIGANVKVEEVRRIKRGEEEGIESLWVRLESEGQRREVMGKKNKLRGRRERIVEDLTWRERKMRWKLENIARTEEKRGKKVWVGYDRMRNYEQWWRWDENEEVLRDEKGCRREDISGEGGRKEGEGIS